MTRRHRRSLEPQYDHNLLTVIETVREEARTAMCEKMENKGYFLLKEEQQETGWLLLTFMRAD